MGFMEAYKRLEKLCGEVMNDERRIGAYIDEMQEKTGGASYVSGWEEDLKQLKHYRWVRNQIVHSPDCSEENMCDPEDVRWIEDFYERIMNQSDPLALYRKATQPASASVKKLDGRCYQGNDHYPYEDTPNRSGCGQILMVIAMAAVMIAIWLLVR